MIPPRLPPATGANAQKARFFLDVASAFEFLALYFSIPATRQAEVIQHMQSLTAEQSNIEAKANRK